MPSKYVMNAGLLVAAFLLVEGLVRIVDYTVFPLYEDKTFFYVDHPQFHHWHQPHFSGINRSLTQEFTMPVRSNELGMVGKEVSVKKPQGVYRIAVLGDSFVEALQTEEENSAVNVLERMLNQTGQRRYEVLNFGCSSFSPSLEYFQLVHFVEKFDPDLVLVMFHLSDVTNDWVYQKGNQVNDQGEVIGISMHKSFLYKLAEKSALLRTIVQRVKALQQSRAIQRSEHLTQAYGAMFKEQYSQEDLKAWKLSKGYLRQMNEWAEQRGVKFGLIVIPAGPQLEPVALSHGQRFPFSANGQILTSTKMQTVLGDWAKEHGVWLLDLLEYGKQFKEKHPDTTLYFPLDQHWTKGGNAMAASAIFEWLRHSEI